MTNSPRHRASLFHPWSRGNLIFESPNLQRSFKAIGYRPEVGWLASSSSSRRRGGCATSSSKEAEAPSSARLDMFSLDHGRILHSRKQVFFRRAFRGSIGPFSSTVSWCVHIASCRFGFGGLRLRYQSYPRVSRVPLHTSTVPSRLYTTQPNPISQTLSESVRTFNFIHDSARAALMTARRSRQIGS